MPLAAQGLSKTYGATRALTNVSIEFLAGRVHALVGENGAGKSTVFKICSGAISPDSGQMTVVGLPFAPRSLRDAQKRGVSLVFQEMTINTALGIAENIFIDRMSEHAGFLGLSRWKRIRTEAQRLLDEIGADISVRQRIESLDLGQLKILEIARALSYRPQVLFLDESTAFLSTLEVDALFRVIHKLKQQNIAVGYISHHLDELDRIADDLTILKDGAWVGNYRIGELEQDEIKAKMVGREVGHNIYGSVQVSTVAERPILSLELLAKDRSLEPLTLTLHTGEILGIGGLKGSGGEIILGMLNGDMRTNARMTLDGKPYRPLNPSASWKGGIATLPGDRTGEGLIVDFSVAVNLSLAHIPEHMAIIDLKAERQMVDEVIQLLQIKTQTPQALCSSLSGGNLQKVVLGKCISAKPRILLLNNPTRGIDVGARAQIYDAVRKLVAEGIAVILLSEDLPELIGLSDRIIIMRKGKISHSFGRGEAPSEEDVIEYMI